MYHVFLMNSGDLNIDPTQKSFYKSCRPFNELVNALFRLSLGFVVFKIWRGPENAPRPILSLSEPARNRAWPPPTPFKPIVLPTPIALQWSDLAERASIPTKRCDRQSGDPRSGCYPQHGVGGVRLPTLPLPPHPTTSVCRFRLASRLYLWGPRGIHLIQK